MMCRTLAAAFGLVSLLVCMSKTHAQTPQPALTLLEKCESWMAGSPTGNECVWFFAGYQAGFVATHNQAVAYFHHKGQFGPFCPKGDFDDDIMARIFVKYGHDHPERMGNTDWQTVVTDALRNAWPCRAQNP
jgi:hypothetical protein